MLFVKPEQERIILARLHSHRGRNFVLNSWTLFQPGVSRDAAVNSVHQGANPVLHSLLWQS